MRPIASSIPAQSRDRDAGARWTEAPLHEDPRAARERRGRRMQGVPLGVVEVVQEHDAGLRHHREDEPEPHERGGVDFATGGGGVGPSQRSATEQRRGEVGLGQGSGRLQPCAGLAHVSRLAKPARPGSGAVRGGPRGAAPALSFHAFEGTPPSPVPTFDPSTLLSRRLLLFTGKGGVGKSTVVASLAMEAARRGGRPLVVELGHRHTMRSIFGSSAAGLRAAPRGPRRARHAARVRRGAHGLYERARQGAAARSPRPGEPGPASLLRGRARRRGDRHPQQAERPRGGAGRGPGAIPSSSTSTPRVTR